MLPRAEPPAILICFGLALKSATTCSQEVYFESPATTNAP
ncbi:Uncharacterised protein [Vibrio cholerae]|uniref:Uncharacterized protein n=1 Tax=Vibrio cholerae TaxID=666 RepID=A0A655PK47_VIBCL|nr:Uncharacterised protein [Vibrio cholerae]